MLDVFFVRDEPYSDCNHEKNIDNNCLDDNVICAELQI